MKLHAALDASRRLALLAVVGMATLGAAPPSPRITSTQWFNSVPLTPDKLTGKVRLVEFWAFECINCARTAPAMRALHERFAGPDAVVIGVHTPELKVERDPLKVAEAIKKYEIHYPVAIDNDHSTWRAFGNQYWPCLYVIDKKGVVRHVHIGELHQGTPDWDQLVALVEKLRHEPA
jgi:thiol-disulfide isomerase/thioredoxin